MDDIALAAALVILGELKPDTPRYQALNLIVASIRVALENFRDEQARRLDVSPN